METCISCAPQGLEELLRLLHRLTTKTKPGLVVFKELTRQETMSCVFMAKPHNPMRPGGSNFRLVLLEPNIP